MRIVLYVIITHTVVQLTIHVLYKVQIYVNFN